jgi:hypothetical protein
MMLNLLGENIYITKKYTEALLIAAEEVGWEINTLKTESVFLSPDYRTEALHKGNW